MKSLLIILVLCLSLISCHQSEIDKLKSENIQLKIELDSIKNHINEEKNARLSGKYFCDDCFYKSLEFRGESSVILLRSISDFQFIESYVKDGKFIRIKTDDQDLLLEIIDAHTLKGEGYGSGTYIKK